MKTYILGAGASRHAGYPLTTDFWPRLVAFAQTPAAHVELVRAISIISALQGTATDIETLLTSLDRGTGTFQQLGVDERRKIMLGITNGAVGLFREIKRIHPQTREYDRFARLVEPGDAVVTFNYDTALDAALARVGVFRAPDGYCLRKDVQEPNASILGPESVEGSLTGAITLIPPMQSKRFNVKTTLGVEWVEFYDHLWSRVAKALSQADEVVMIGYSMPHADNRACGTIFHHTKKHALIRVFCGDGSEDIAERFFAHGFLRVRAGGYFEDFLDLKSMPQTRLN